MTPSHLTLPFAAILAGGVSAQPIVDIDLHSRSSASVEVQLTPKTDFGGVFSSLVFTITWEAATGEETPELQQTMEQRAIMVLAPSGPVHEVGGKRYLIYSGIGLTPIEEVGQPWRGGMSTSIGTFELGISKDITLADDAWVKERRNNGAFYVSLNGLDRTGHVGTRSATISGTGPLSITLAPNPSNAQLVAFLVNNDKDGLLVIDITDAEGRLVHTHQCVVINGLAQGSLTHADMLAPGIYSVTARTGTSATTERLVVMGRIR